MAKEYPIVDNVESFEAALARVRAAQKVYATYTQEQVDKIFKAAALAANNMRIPLAKMAVEETGMGVVEDKVIKNHYAAEYIYNAYKDTQTVGVLERDEAFGMMKVAEPIGVVAAVIPTTNPTSTAIFKTLICLKTRNGIIISPHPRAKKSTIAAAKVVLEAAVAAGAPEDIISWVDVPSLELTNMAMKEADIILATGGPGMVKAAYSSGTPALGVGAGNVPAYIERSANIEDAVAKIMASKTFDNGTICASEQSIVTESVIAAQVKRALIAQGGFFLEGENLTRVKAVMERGNGSMNPAIVGRDAMTIARIAGIEVPAGTRLLISDEQGVGAKFPFSKEKLTALLGFYVVNDWHQACELCHALLHNCGIGHSLAIHSNNEDVIREFGLKKPVSRILVNTPSTQGGVGLTTALFPSFTLGCGAVGGSATSDNVTPMNLLNIRRVAYDLGSSMCRHHDCHAEAPKSCCSAASSCANAAGTSSIDINAITSLIVAELKKVM